jgi:hypothetical protein
LATDVDPLLGHPPPMLMAMQPKPEADLQA